MWDAVGNWVAGMSLKSWGSGDSDLGDQKESVWIEMFACSGGSPECGTLQPFPSLGGELTCFVNIAIVHPEDIGKSSPGPCVLRK